MEEKPDLKVPEAPPEEPEEKIDDAPFISIRKAHKLKIGVEISDVLIHLEFLREIDDRKIFYHPESPFIGNALRRYQRLWIPFAKKNKQIKICPPLGNIITLLIYYTIIYKRVLLRSASVALHIFLFIKLSYLIYF